MHTGRTRALQESVRRRIEIGSPDGVLVCSYMKGGSLVVDGRVTYKFKTSPAAGCASSSVTSTFRPHSISHAIPSGTKPGKSTWGVGWVMISLLGAVWFKKQKIAPKHKMKDRERGFTCFLCRAPSTKRDTWPPLIPDRTPRPNDRALVDLHGCCWCCDPESQNQTTERGGVQREVA